MKNKILFVVVAMLISTICLLQNASAEQVEAGFGKIKLNGLLQFWYNNDNGATPKDTFRLRRAEIKLSGEINKYTSWAVMFDPAQVREDDVKTKDGNVTSVGRKSALQDFIISLKVSKNCSIDFGQYKVPFGMEGLESSAKLDFIERSALASQFKWADYRDVGFTVKGNLKLKDAEIQTAIGLFNGEGQNKLDANSPMDFVGRLVVQPNNVKGLHLGLAHYSGKTGATKIDNVRTGLEVKFEKEKISAKGEYATGESGGKKKETYYVSYGYKFQELYQAVLRYDWYDPDKDKADDASSETTLGLNYFLEKHNAKIQLNYVFRKEEGASISNDVARINVQISY